MATHETSMNGKETLISLKVKTKQDMQDSLQWTVGAGFSQAVKFTSAGQQKKCLFRLLTAYLV